MTSCSRAHFVVCLVLLNAYTCTSRAVDQGCLPGHSPFRTASDCGVWSCDVCSSHSTITLSTMVWPLPLLPFSFVVSQEHSSVSVAPFLPAVTTSVSSHHPLHRAPASVESGLHPPLPVSTAQFCGLRWVSYALTRCCSPFSATYPLGLRYFPFSVVRMSSLSIRTSRFSTGVSLG